MKHRVGFNRLGRKPAHRKSLHRNMVTSLFRHERIRTTKAKAQAIRRTAEKMITRAKVDSVHNRRIVARDIKDKNVLSKLFVEIGPRFKDRPGGYTRMLKIGYRQGDAAPMVLLELLHADEESGKEEKKRGRSGRRSDGGDKSDAKKSTGEKAGAKKSASDSSKSASKKESAAEKASKEESADAAVAEAEAPEESAEAVGEEVTPEETPVEEAAEQPADASEEETEAEGDDSGDGADDKKDS